MELRSQIQDEIDAARADGDDEKAEEIESCLPYVSMEYL